MTARRLDGSRQNAYCIHASRALVHTHKHEYIAIHPSSANHRNYPSYIRPTQSHRNAQSFLRVCVGAHATTTVRIYFFFSFHNHLLYAFSKSPIRCCHFFVFVCLFLTFLLCIFKLMFVFGQKRWD